ncbi:MAG: hypothetical protein ACJZ79_00110 [Pseudohongiellaceae bacterium]
MKLQNLFLFVSALAFLPSAIFSQSAEPMAHGVRNDLPRPYETQRDWGTLPAGTEAWAAVTGVEPSPDGSFIYVIHRCFENSCANRLEQPILKFDYEGQLISAFGEGLFVFPHGATVDYEGNLWVADAQGNDGIGHQVIKFSPNGEVLMTLGRAGFGGAGRIYCIHLMM